MSEPYSPSSAPEFAAQHDYSDILGTSTPESQPQSSHVSAADLAAPSLTAQDLALKQYERGVKALARQDYAQARSAYKAAIE